MLDVDGLGGLPRGRKKRDPVMRGSFIQRLDAEAAAAQDDRTGCAWTREEDIALQGMVRARLAPSEMAKALRRSRKSVERHILDLPLLPLKPITVRKCLRCERTFEHDVNRLCPLCHAVIKEYA